MPGRILVIDDESQITRVLRASLSAQGYDVRTANDPEEALRVFKDWPPDLVITDLMMPDLNGASAAEIMKLQGNTTPVIALTGLSSQDIDLVQDKFSRIYHKPINIGELFEYVESLLGK